MFIDILIGLLHENFAKEAVAYHTFMTSRRNPLWNGDIFNSQMA